MFDRETDRAGAPHDRTRDGGIVELCHRAAIRTDKELAAMPARRIAAPDEGVQRLDPVDQLMIAQEIQRPVDGGGRYPVAFATQPVENVVGADRTMAGPDQLQHPAAQRRQTQTFRAAFALRRVERIRDAGDVIVFPRRKRREDIILRCQFGFSLGRREYYVMLYHSDYDRHTMATSMNRYLLSWAVAAACCISGGATVAAPPLTAPHIVASIAPVHSLVSSVAEGITTPTLLLPPGASPHSFTLRPSDARALNGADLVVWIGPVLENFLDRPVRALAGRNRLLTLTEIEGMRMLPARGPDHDGHKDHEDHASKEHSHAGAGGYDPHLWLSPGNAKAIASAVAERLARLDPPHAGNYRDNLARTLSDIDRTTRDIEVLLAPVKRFPFMTFHDGFQYFERAFTLNSVGWIAVDAGRRPSAKRLSALRRTLQDSGAKCLFSEPQFAPSLLRTVAEGSGAQIGSLDPLGAAIDPGPAHWGETMLALGRSLRSCLSRR